MHRSDPVGWLICLSIWSMMTWMKLQASIGTPMSMNLLLLPFFSSVQSLIIQLYILGRKIFIFLSKECRKSIMMSDCSWWRWICCPSTCKILLTGIFGPYTLYSIICVAIFEINILFLNSFTGCWKSECLPSIFPAKNILLSMGFCMILILDMIGVLQRPRPIPNNTLICWSSVWSSRLNHSSLDSSNP